MIAVFSFLYALVLFSQLSSRTLTVAQPASKPEDRPADGDVLGLIFGDESMTEPAVYRGSQALDDSMRDEDRRPRITFISDARLKGLRGLNRAVVRSPPPLLAGRRWSDAPPAERGLKIERRNTDLDVLRCMVGRVYRPCWEAGP